MTKKSFKKGVDNLIQSTADKEERFAEREIKKTRVKKKVDMAFEKQQFVIELGKQLIISNAEDAKKKILKAFDEGKNVVLKSNYIEDIDLAFIQLILSAKKTFEENENQLKIDFNFSETASEIINSSGFSDVFHN